MASPTIQLGNSGGGFVLAFRGDNRNPNVIFISGFQRQATGGPIVYRKDAFSITGTIMALKPGDLEPTSAVTFSKRLRVATMFPLREGPEDPQESVTYVYMIAVEASEIYNTHQKQVEDGLRGMEQWSEGNAIGEVEAKILMWPLYAQEMAALRVPSTDIIAAVACRRRWAGPNYKSGLTYRLEGKILWNPQCALPRGLKNLASDFLEIEVNQHGAGTSPAVESGYHPV